MENETMESALQLYLENYKAYEDELCIYISHNQKNFDVVGTEDFSVFLGKEKLPVKSIETVVDSGENMTFLCLVDVSGSLDKERMEEIKETLTSIKDNLKVGDNLSVVAMGDTLRNSGFLTSKEEIQTQIDALEVLHEDTNLYQSITQMLQLLKTSQQVNEKRCLIILSDGAEDNAYGITLDEVNAVVEESHIPIYTVGMVKNTKQQSYLDNVKLLGSFARISQGGKHYVPKIDNLTGEEIGDAIYGDMSGGLIVKADTSKLHVTGQEVYLQVEFSDEVYGSAEVSINAPDGNLIINNEEEIEIIEEVIEEESIEQAKKDNGMFMVLLIGGIVLFLVIIIVVLLLVLKKKKKQNEEFLPDLNEDTDELSETESLDVAESENEVIKQKQQQFNTMAGVESAGVRVRLVRMGNKESATLFFDINNRVSMGRDKSKVDFALENDNGLSSVHCIFTYQNDCLYLEDANSTNGTYVNGVPIKTPMRLQQDDVVLVGSYEYRIGFGKIN